MRLRKGKDSSARFLQGFALGVGLLAAYSQGWAASTSRTATLPPAVSSDKSSGAGPLIAVISISDQRVTVWGGDNKVVARSSVSTGMSGHRTPTGIFSVIGKERYHESNLYSNAPMPFMQRITWSGVALHAGHLPGYPASHGCIRLPEDFAQRLFGLTRTGMRVIVSDRDVSPFSISHPNLPVPTLVRESQIAELVAPLRFGQPGALTPSALVGNPVLPEGRMHLGASTETLGRVLNPMERGKLEQSFTKLAYQEAQVDAQALIEIASMRGDEARIAVDQLRSAEAALNALRAGLAKAIEAVADATTSAEERARAELSRASLKTAHAEAVQRLAEVRGFAESSDAAAFQAAAEAKAAVAERDALQDAARIAERATEPVSVFVSRKDHKVYVRQGFEPVFEADVDIADGQNPLGTHVFTAMNAPGANNALEWVSTTVASAAPEVERPRPGKAQLQASGPATALLPATAANALSRVKFSETAMQKISEKVWTGASLIISDYGISHETGKGTDFVILTRSAN